MDSDIYSDRFFEIIHKELKEKNNIFDIVTDFLKMCKNDKIMTLNIINNENIKEKTAELLFSNSNSPKNDVLFNKYLFSVGGSFSIINYWLKNDFTESEEEIAKIITEKIKKTFSE